MKKVLLTSLNSKYVHSNLALKDLYMAGKDMCPGLEIREFTINNSRDYIFIQLFVKFGKQGIALNFASLDFLFKAAPFRHIHCLHHLAKST